MDLAPVGIGSWAAAYVEVGTGQSQEIHKTVHQNDELQLESKLSNHIMHISHFSPGAGLEI